MVDASPTLKWRWAQAFEELVRFKLPIQLTDKYDRSFVSVSPVKQVARRLTFEEVVSDTDMQSAIPFCVAPSVATTKSGRGRMKRCGTPLVAPPVNFSSRRMTRSVAKLNGFKPISAVPIKPKPLRQPRSKKSKLDVDALVNATPTTENEKSEAQRHRRCHPPTPICVMQSLGASLGIPSEKLYVEKLMADPSCAPNDESANDK